MNTALPPNTLDHPAAWRGAEIVCFPDRWVWTLTDAEVTELEAAASQYLAGPYSMWARGRNSSRRRIANANFTFYLFLRVVPCYWAVTPTMRAARDAGRPASARQPSP